jgi:hypothetical protein
VLEAEQDLEARMQRGWHLLRAGEERAGAELLANTSRAFIHTSSAREDSQSVIAALRAALEIYERHGRSPHERAALLFPLVLLCYYCPDHRLILQYAPQALQLGLDITGLDFAQKAKRWLGKQRALRVGMWLAERRFAVEREQRGLQMTLAQAIGALSSLVPASMGAFGCHYDTQGAEAIGALAEPLGLFAQNQLPSLMYTWKDAQAYLVRGLEGDTHACIERVLAQMQQPAIREALGDAHFRSLRGGALFMLGLVSCYRGSQSACEIADEMETLGVRLWAMVADQVRLLHHAYRGEAERVQHYRERVERFAMQGGPTWHTELFWPAAMLNADVLCCDTIAVRRTYQQLERSADEVPSLRVHAACARAAYLSLRGDHAQAIACYEPIVAELEPRQSIAWLPTRGLFARALNQAGEHARAKALLLETFQHVTETDRAVRVLCFEPRRQLAIAQAALGDRAQALASLQALLVEYQADDNPLLLGLLHETLARCALLAADRAAFDLHLARAESYLCSTRNPVLIAHVNHVKLAAADVQDDTASAAAAGPAVTDLSRSRSHYSLGELSIAPDRSRYALDLMIQQTQAKGGCLYLLDGTSLQLAAASAVNEPPHTLELALLEQIQRSQFALSALDEPDAATRLFDSLRTPGMPSVRARPENDQLHAAAAAAPQQGDPFRTLPAPAPSADEHRIVLLTARQGGRATTVGGVILTLPRGTNVQLDAQLLQAVAEAVRPAMSPSRRAEQPRS